ncbi:hypothetical protein DFR39_103100 [Roseateles asaccharophilus]|uniref:Uncharacterized protein n=1 Tax=Roseateles asaccharophilus TaxID=582607 RepID=A0A4R6N7U3_9BURK|nr:hypothetical protein DFR39_103100 [Roseateles asaccharophilus]
MTRTVLISAVRLLAGVVQLLLLLALGAAAPPSADDAQAPATARLAPARAGFAQIE